MGNGGTGNSSGGGDTNVNVNIPPVQPAPPATMRRKMIQESMNYGRSLIALFVISIIGFSAAAYVSGCTKQESKTIANVTAKVADETCKVLQNDPATTSETVALACAIEGVVSGTVRVVMSQKAWGAVRAASGAGAK